MNTPRRNFDEKFIDLMRPDLEWDQVKGGVHPKAALAWAINSGVDTASQGSELQNFEVGDILDRLFKWSASETYFSAAWDSRWDTSRYLPSTDEFHKKLSAAHALDYAGRLIQSYERVLRGARADDEAMIGSEKEAILARLEAVLRVTSPIQRVFLSLGANFGIGVIDGGGTQIMVEDMSNREQLRISPDGSFNADALYEEAHLNGEPEPTLEDLAHFFSGVERIIHFESAVTMMEQLAALSSIDPDLHKMCLSFYKQHKSMIFSQKLERFDKAAEKLLEILDAKAKELGESEAAPYVEAVASIIDGYREFARTMMTTEVGLYNSISTGTFSE